MTSGWLFVLDTLTAAMNAATSPLAMSNTAGVIRASRWSRRRRGRGRRERGDMRPPDGGRAGRPRPAQVGEIRVIVTPARGRVYGPGRAVGPVAARLYGRDRPIRSQQIRRRMQLPAGS